jgi:hypothetical protein
VDHNISRGLVGRVAGVTAAVMVVAGCNNSHIPKPPPYYNISYNEELTVAVPGDSVLVSIGTECKPGRDPGLSVYVDAQASDDGSARFNMHVVGFAYAQGQRAVINPTWAGDTLSIWCGAEEPRWPQSLQCVEKDSPALPWFFPERVDIVVPSGVGVRYIGRWYR